MSDADGSKSAAEKIPTLPPPQAPSDVGEVSEHHHLRRRVWNVRQRSHLLPRTGTLL